MLSGTSTAVLAFEDRQLQLSEIDARAEALAAVLAADGVRAGDRVAVMSSNRPEFVIAVRAIWRLGAVAALISPAWKRDEVAHALALAQPGYALGDHPVLAELMPMRHLDDITTTPAGRWAGDPPPAGSDALLVFSSGTTGMPKAVRHTHASLAAAVEHWRDALGLSAADRLQVATPPSHILGLLNIATALSVGAWVRLHRRFDVDVMLRSIETDRITVEMAVAPIALAIAAHPGLESFDLSSLRFIMWGATPVTAAVADTVTRRTGVPFVPAYGTSELPVIACNPVGAARLDSVGMPVPGVEVKVVGLDGDTAGQPVPPGVAGEILVRSASLMAGYLPASATAEVVRDGWFHTGDVGYLDGDGWLRITDRCKEMIKVRGFQVAPAEIEAVLHEHPAVADCGVFGVPDERDGEAVVAAVALRAPVSDAELCELVGERLASYKRLRRVVFVPEIPRLPSGKLLRRLLKESLWTSG
ncbi:class I adenylate-forming enzyme family protein [Mycolicibacter hiberniae]|uniref:Acyl-CoA synthetase n=1 Tax=Mycolicibacter hiberniae TaxID=29314 RepID=A0A7I7X4A2_9MYCO|nr:AMP-binding protein [Mycolicibacter hiberniae]MCV7086345.1 AMP-binding protein [Mycolicibacter hiberniae]ORV69566.1 AMP-dependent synthetase [Mycolicibacter hiberniae]BBZ24496.1 acyl-CoA synthetase [Mycolicibacter hiberniae]